MGLFKRGDSWYLDYRRDGIRVRESIGVVSKKVAQAALDARKGEAIQNRFRIRRPKQRVRFASYCDDYLKHCQGYKRSYQRTTQLVGQLMRHFQSLFMDEVSPVLIEKFKAQRVLEVNPATVNRELSCLRHMFNLAINWGHDLENPIKKVRFFQEDPPPPRILTAQEANRLVNECSDTIRPIVVTALHTGMRLREILGLQWRYVDLVQGQIVVTGTKTRTNRYLPIDPTMTRLLTSREQSTPFVFPNRNGKPFDNIHRGFKGAVKRAELGYVRFHDLRHTFASHLVMNGVDLVTVKELLGHTNIATTMRYSHLNDEHKRRALERLPFGDGPNLVPKMKVVRSGNL